MGVPDLALASLGETPAEAEDAVAQLLALLFVHEFVAVTLLELRKALVGRNLRAWLPYNRCAGHWSSASFGLRPGVFRQVPSGLFLSSLPLYSSESRLIV
jgi:hypothetical protein